MRDQSKRKASQHAWYERNKATLQPRRNAYRRAKRAATWPTHVPDLEGEQWRPVPDWEGVYEVSCCGRVKRIARGLGTKGVPYCLKPVLAKKVGYYYVMLGHSKRVAIHQLVAAAFLERTPYSVEINHIDGCKTNNVVGNLQWVTRSENHYHAVRLGLMPVGESHKSSKLTEAQAMAVLTADPRVPHKELATLYGVSGSAIAAIRNRVTWKHLSLPDEVSSRSSLPD